MALSGCCFVQTEAPGQVVGVQEVLDVVGRLRARQVSQMRYRILNLIGSTPVRTMAFRTMLPGTCPTCGNQKGSLGLLSPNKEVGTEAECF